MRVFAQIYCSHTALTEQFNDPIMGDRLADHLGVPSKREKRRRGNREAVGNSNLIGNPRFNGGIPALNPWDFKSYRSEMIVNRALARVLAQLAAPETGAIVFAFGSLIRQDRDFAKSAALTARPFPLRGANGMSSGHLHGSEQESIPLRASLFMGTPRTGSVVWAPNSSEMRRAAGLRR